MHGSRNKTEQYRRRVYFAIYKKETFNNLYNFFYKVNMKESVLYLIRN